MRFLLAILIAISALHAADRDERVVQASVSGTLYAPFLRTTGAVVYLIPDGDSAFAVPQERPVIDQVKLRFHPQTVAVLPGTSVEFRNSDPVLHNVFGPTGPGDGFDLGTYPRGEQRLQIFNELGVHVILCNVHPEMVAYVLVVPTPYNSVVNTSGEFYIEDVPTGLYSVWVWHPRIDPFSTMLTVGEGVSGIHLDLEIPQ